MGKNIWQILFGAAVAVIIFLLVRSCNGGKYSGGGDTTIVRDTTYLKTEPVSVPNYVPIPYAVIKYRDTGSYRYIPGEDFIAEADTAAILADYNKKFIYRDTVEVDSNRVVIQDTVSRNRIMGRWVEFTIRTQVIETTMTIEKEAEPRNQVYAGLFAFSNKEVDLYGGGAVISLKTKKNRLISVRPGFSNHGFMFSFGHQWLIRFNKRK